MAATERGGERGHGHHVSLMLRSVIVSVLVLAWYAHSMQWNIELKTALSDVVWQQVVLVNLIQFFTAAVIMLLLALASVPIARIKADLSVMASFKPADVLTWVVPVSGSFMLGTMATCFALTQSSVGFTHLIKIMEPLFAVATALVLFGQRPTGRIVMYLCLIVLGIAQLVVDNMAFSLYSFVAASLSNLFQQIRNVVASRAVKHDLKDSLGRLSPLMLTFLWCAVAVVILLPFSLTIILFDQSLLTVCITSLANPAKFCGLWPATWFVGFHFGTYQAAAFNVLGVVTPVTHAVLNSCKRLFIIACAFVLYGGDPFAYPLRTAFGVLLTSAGIVGYTVASKQQQQQHKEGKEGKGSPAAREAEKTHDNTTASLPSSRQDLEALSASVTSSKASSAKLKHATALDSPVVSLLVGCVLLVVVPFRQMLVAFHNGAADTDF